MSPVGRPGGVDEVETLFLGDRHRLLEENVRASLQEIGRDRVVEVMWERDQRRVHLAEHVVVVGDGGRLLELSGGLARPVAIGVDGRDDPRANLPGERVGVAAGHPATAHDGDVDHTPCSPVVYVHLAPGDTPTPRGSTVPSVENC